MRKIFIPLIMFAAGFASGRYCVKATSGISHATISDTVLIHDTIRYTNPSPADSVRIRTVVRYLERMVSASDTVRDTVRVMVPISSVTYSTPQFAATVSGFEPRLDSITVYPETRLIRGKPRKWNIGVSAGVCVTPRGVSPGVSVGVTYSLF